MKPYFFTFLIFLLSSKALAGELCKELIPDEAALFQSYDLGKDFACLYSTSDTDEYATLSFYSKQKNASRLIASNKSLITANDARDQMNVPDINKSDNGSVQLLWSYPNGVDWLKLSFSNGELYLVNAGKELRLPVSLVEGEVNSLVLVNVAKGSSTVPFSKINRDQVFDKNALSLEPGSFAAAVSQDKATLYIDASEGSRTKGYLIKGDRVRILEYRFGFLKIAYESKSGAVLHRWIELSSVI